MTNKIETTILKNLVHNETYVRSVLPFLKDDYFSNNAEKTVFRLISNFITKYNKPPTIEALEIALQNSNYNEVQYKDTFEVLRSLGSFQEPQQKWLLDETEKFCKDKAVYNAILQSIGILEGNEKKYSKDSIPSLLQEALAVCFDSSVGHDYFDDSEKRFESYNRVESRIPFDLSIFNTITGGGVPNKTLNLILASTGAGKSLFMCHVAASSLAMGKNVLYITLEMAEERIAERIDANLLNVDIGQLKNLPKSMFSTRVKKLNDKTTGKLIIKEYPTASAHAGHFKALLSELALKRSFKPDIIFIDYLNICASSRLSSSSGVNSYSYIKAIAEEIRGLAVEYDVPIFSATQTNRTGFSNTDVDLTNTSESIGVPATADLMFALISTEELEGLGQLMIKQLKNRYNDPNLYKRFMIGVDRAKMKLHDLEQSAQTTLTDPGITDVEDIPNEFNFSNHFKPKKDFSAIKI